MRNTLIPGRWANHTPHTLNAACAIYYKLDRRHRFAVEEPDELASWQKARLNTLHVAKFASGQIPAWAAWSETMCVLRSQVWPTR